MKVTALAGGIGAGKFLRGLVEVVPAEDVTVVVNTADDIVLHGLHVSPDLDSVMYWLAGLMDRERGWGLADETFRTTERLTDLEAEGSWFGLGDLDMATHLLRTALIGDGSTLAEATAVLTQRYGVVSRLLPMSDDPVTTMITTEGGEALHFQDYWVRRGGADQVASIDYRGADEAAASPDVMGSIRDADAILICPSNPVASVFPILAVPGIREELASRRDHVVGISPIVGGAPVRGMADRLMPAAGYEVTASEAARCYEELIGGWVMDERDTALITRVEAMGVRVAVTDTIMEDDARSASIAQTALDLV